MTEHHVIFHPYDKTVDATDGETLIRLAMRAGLHINASCGGAGVCGKCRVVIEGGEVEGGITEKLDTRDLAGGVRLACQCRVRSDLVVRIPVESEVDASVLNKAVTGRRTAYVHQVSFEELKESGLFIPPVEKRYLELPPPSSQDRMPDVTRVINYLKMRFDEHWRAACNLHTHRDWCWSILTIFTRLGSDSAFMTLMKSIIKGPPFGISTPKITYILMAINV